MPCHLAQGNEVLTVDHQSTPGGHPQTGDRSRLGESTSNDYRILLPSNTDINLTVFSQGYKSWSYPGVINVGPGQDMTLDIQMERLPSTNK
jgi:hypothetical protein